MGRYAWLKFAITKVKCWKYLFLSIMWNISDMLNMPYDAKYTWFGKRKILTYTSYGFVTWYKEKKDETNAIL